MVNQTSSNHISLDLQRKVIFLCVCVHYSRRDSQPVFLFNLFQMISEFLDAMQYFQNYPIDSRSLENCLRKLQIFWVTEQILE